MRINTATQYERSIETLQQRQQALQASQERLTSGKRVTRPSDDPTAAARAERALARQVRIDADRRAVDASRQTMTQAESALGDSIELMQRVRELVVQAGNPIYGPAQRASLVDEMRILRQQLFEAANRTDGTGSYLFAGQGASAAPFLESAQGVVFRGTPGENTAAGQDLPIAVDGRAAWLAASSGNGVFVTGVAEGNSGGAWVNAGQVTDPAAISGASYRVEFSDAGGGAMQWEIVPAPDDGPSGPQPFVSGQAIEFDGVALSISGSPADGDAFTVEPSSRDLSLFDVVDRLILELGDAGRSGAQVTQTVQFGMRDLDAAMAMLSATRSRLGGVLAQAEGLEQRLGDEKIVAQTERAAAEDLDIAEAATEFQSRQTSYDAALRAYSMIQDLSLFDYIR
jgi:flagellar hook-associated protein 3 FlgL